MQSSSTWESRCVDFCDECSSAVQEPPDLENVWQARVGCMAGQFQHYSCSKTNYLSFGREIAVSRIWTEEPCGTWQLFCNDADSMVFDFCRDSWWTMSKADYYEPSDILAGETLVPVTFNTGARYVCFSWLLGVWSPGPVLTWGFWLQA